MILEIVGGFNLLALEGPEQIQLLLLLLEEVVIWTWLRWVPGG